MIKETVGAAAGSAEGAAAEEWAEATRAKDKAAI